MEPQQRPILVALGSEARALRLIQAGLRLSRERSSPWIAVHVETGGSQLVEDAEQVQVWLQEAQRLGAGIQIIQAPTLAQGLSELTRTTHAQVLLLGRSQNRWPWARVGHSTADELQRRGLDAHIEVMDDRTSPAGQDARDTGFGAMVGAMSVLAAASGVAWLLPREGNIALVLPVFLAAVTFIAHHWGQRLAVLASVLSALLYNFLLETPRFSGASTHWPNLLFFLAMLLAAQAVVGLLHRLRQTGPRGASPGGAHGLALPAGPGPCPQPQLRGGGRYRRRAPPPGLQGRGLPPPSTGGRLANPSRVQPWDRVAPTRGAAGPAGGR
ncbi:MAG: DUF4118 domain-containing protein [Holophagaceae bacterium]|nr:DUF4118 domain-containing protein [Holophagaceae bacterium]